MSLPTCGPAVRVHFTPCTWTLTLSTSIGRSDITFVTSMSFPTQKRRMTLLLSTFPNGLHPARRSFPARSEQAVDMTFVHFWHLQLLPAVNFRRGVRHDFCHQHVVPHLEQTRDMTFVHFSTWVVPRPKAMSSQTRR